MKQSILIVDDEPAIRFGFVRYLTKAGFTVAEASCLSEAREIISSQQYDAVIVDQKLPDGNGIDWIGDLRDAYPGIAIVIITGAGDIPLAVEAMRRGADNFLTKPVKMGDLDVFLRKSLELGGLRRRDLTQRRLVKKIQPFFGESEAMKKVKQVASLAADNDNAVLLQGETGTGKGVLAHWIHEHSGRKDCPFVEINCSSLRGELLASELFGHTRGAFTSAIQDRQGLIEISDGGVLFLDEIGDLDPAVQAQLLKVIEEKCFRRLGEVKVRKSDFRLICASNKDLRIEMEAGRFRPDLYFRIQMVPIHIPPLRERIEDMSGLVRRILPTLNSRYSDVTPEVMSLLKRYFWPGNIRELKTVLERAHLLAQGNALDPQYFCGLASSNIADYASDRREKTQGLDQLEENYIKSMIKRSGGDMEKAADALGVSRATLYRKLKKFRQSSR